MSTVNTGALHDGFVPNTEPGVIPPRIVGDGEAAEFGAETPIEQLRRLPDGFQYERNGTNSFKVVPTRSSVAQIAVYAEQMLARAIIPLRDKPTEEMSLLTAAYDAVFNIGLPGIAALVDEFAEKDHLWALENMPANVAGYNACQAAKCALDAESRAQYLTRIGQDAGEDANVQNLIARSQAALSTAAQFYLAAKQSKIGCTVRFEAQAWKVSNNAAKRLTEWAQKQTPAAEAVKHSTSATALLIGDLLGRKAA